MNAAAWGRGVRKRVDVRKVPASVLALVDERQGKRCCAECGATENLELDHRIPLAKGGDNHHRNLQWLCKPCNGRKGSQKQGKRSMEDRLRNADC